MQLLKTSPPPVAVQRTWIRLAPCAAGFTGRCKFKWQIALLMAFVLLAPVAAAAHPVTFEGGTMPVFEIDGDNYSSRINYSFTSKAALGVHYHSVLARQAGRIHSTAASINYLFKRWISSDSQGNLYGWAGPLGQYAAGRERPGAVFGMQADWESRRLYSALDSENHLVVEGVNYSDSRIRAGFAPYIADYESVHMFIIGQARYSYAGTAEGWTFSPLIRIFRGPLLAEFGVSNQGDLSGMLMAQIYF